MDRAESVAVRFEACQHYRGDSCLTKKGNNGVTALTTSTLHNLLAGAVAGSAGVLVGHPFDSYKVRLQTRTPSPPVNSTRTAMASLPLTSNPSTFRSLFRGLAPPFCTAGLVNALVFVSYTESSKAYRQQLLINNDLTNDLPPSPLSSFLQPIACGGFTGLVSSLVICPAEHVKCRLQVMHGKRANASSSPARKGSMGTLRMIVGRHGISGLYRGFTATCLRQGPSLGIYFGSYDRIKHAVRYAFPEKQHELAASALAGGIAGSLSWAAIYPMDVIKSQIQTTSFRESTSIRYVTQTIYRNGGRRAFYRGIGITVLRAFPVNGVIFTMYEYGLERLR